MTGFARPHAHQIFRPCIDLHDGEVKQIVGASLTDGRDSPTTNFVATHSSAWYAELFAQHDLTGGHVIQLGQGNETAARAALAAFPGGLQVGGGVTPANAATWLDAGASHVIVTSWMFDNGRFSQDRVDRLVETVGADRVVLDLSCAIDPDRSDRYVVMTDRWQRRTDLTVDADTLEALASSCAEFLVHGVAVEGLQSGMDLALLDLLDRCSPIPVTYAGGARSLDDLRYVASLPSGRVCLTIGSALDIFGGSGVTLDDCVTFVKTLTY